MGWQLKLAGHQQEDEAMSIFMIHKGEEFGLGILEDTSELLVMRGMSALCCFHAGCDVDTADLNRKDDKTASDFRMLAILKERGELLDRLEELEDLESSEAGEKV
jgi:tRNA threonylcarbamoyladenosine modification (KEOPS) complex Cgi121 subunit